MTSPVTGAVLAAGAGRRMGQPKAELVVGGVRLLDRAVATLIEGGCDEVLAVVRDGVTVHGARCVVNQRPESGLRSSLALAVAAAEAGSTLVVILVDMPGVPADAIRAVVSAALPGRVAIAHYDGRRGHPIAMSTELWREALAAAGPDEGARAFMGVHPELVDEVAVTGEPTDLDEPDDLARWAADH